MGCVWIITFTLNGNSSEFEKHTGGDYSKPSDMLVRQWIAEHLIRNVGEIRVEQ